MTMSTGMANRKIFLVSIFSTRQFQTSRTIFNINGRHKIMISKHSILDPFLESHFSLLSTYPSTTVFMKDKKS